MTSLIEAVARAMLKEDVVETWFSNNMSITPGFDEYVRDGVDRDWRNYEDAAKAAIAAINASGTHVVVPREPTEAMEADGVVALLDAGLDSPDGIGPTDVKACFRAMLKASQGDE